MRTTFVAVALCAATALATPRHHRRVDAQSTVSKLESELPELSTPTLTTRRRRTDVIKEVESEISKVGDSVPVDVRRDILSEIETEVESETYKVEDSLRVRSLPSDIPSLPSDIPSSSSLPIPEHETDVLDEVLADVEDILSSDSDSQSKVQDILNTIINDIEARNTERSEPVAIRSMLEGLDLDILDTLDLSGLLADLECLVSALEQEAISVLEEVDPQVADLVSDLLDDVNDVVSEVESEAGLRKRDLLGLDLTDLNISGLDLGVIDELDLSGLIHDIECLVSKLEKAVIKELRGVDPSLARTVKHLLHEVNSVVSEVEDAAGL